MATTMTRTPVPVSPWTWHLYWKQKYPSLEGMFYLRVSAYVDDELYGLELPLHVVPLVRPEWLPPDAYELIGSALWGEASPEFQYVVGTYSEAYVAAQERLGELFSVVFSRAVATAAGFAACLPKQRSNDD